MIIGCHARAPKSLSPYCHMSTLLSDCTFLSPLWCLSGNNTKNLSPFVYVISQLGFGNILDIFSCMLCWYEVYQSWSINVMLYQTLSLFELLMNLSWERVYFMSPKRLSDKSYAGARFSVYQSPVKRCFSDEHGSWVKVVRTIWDNALVKHQFSNMSWTMLASKNPSQCQ